MHARATTGRDSGGLTQLRSALRRQKPEDQAQEHSRDAELHLPPLRRERDRDAGEHARGRGRKEQEDESQRACKSEDVPLQVGRRGRVGPGTEA